MFSIAKRALHATSQVPRVVVTGMGVLSPIGTNLEEAWTRVIAGDSGIVSLEDPEYEKLPCRVGGKIKDIDKLFMGRFSKSELLTMAPSTAMALIATEEALLDSKWKPENPEEKQYTGVAIGVGMVDLNDICQTYENLKSIGYRKVSPYFVPRILPNMAAGQISIKYGIQGPNHSVSTACATGAHSIGDAFRFIRNGDAKVMICGGAESCISPLSIAGFCRLKALATNFNDSPKTASRPFDKQRNGFVMGEGSAILILEELQHALSRKAKIYAEVLGYGLSGDGFHLTAPCEDGQGALLAMGRAIKSANLSPEDVGYLNAHATSTPLGDVIESKAINTLFGDHVSEVKVSSTKGSHGHLLGAAGNLECVLTIKAIETKQLPPSINLENIDENIKLNFVANKSEEWKTLRGDKRRVALKNAFGFGGTNASLCFAEYKLD